MKFPSYIILPSYTIDRDDITFKINASEYNLYLEWMGCADEWTFRNNVNVNQYKAKSIFFAHKVEEMWEGFILKGVSPKTLSLKEDDNNEFEITLIYDQYNTVTPEYTNKVLKYEIRKDKIQDLL